jgi:hypothetical protein
MNPKGAFAEFKLSPAEQMAIASDDEDALRRLTGSDPEGYAALGQGGLDAAARAGNLNWQPSKYHCTWFCETFICPTQDNWPTCCFQSCALR